MAGEAAAEIYGLNVLVRDIEDLRDNTTRFLVIGRKLAAQRQDKTTLLVSAHETAAPARCPAARAAGGARDQPVAHRVAAVAHAKWDYVFFIDLEGHAADREASPALEELRSQRLAVPVLGSYPRAVL